MSKGKLLAIAFGAAFVLITFTAIIAVAGAGGYADKSPMNFEMNLQGVGKDQVELQQMREAVASLVGTSADNVAVVELENIDGGGGAGGCKAVVQILPQGVSRDHVTNTLTLADSDDDGKADDTTKEATFVKAFDAAGIKGCSGCSCAPVKTAPVAATGSAATAPPAGSTKCTPKKSVKGDCSRCLDSGQCEEGAFCCPYMKLCVKSSSQGCAGAAICSPRCFDATGCKCSHKDAQDWPNNWVEPTCTSRLR
eukprot:g3263.t1